MAKRYPKGYFNSRDGYCRHGVYVGGCGIDWMCGRCESGDEDKPHFWRDAYRFTPSVLVLTIDGARTARSMLTFRGAREIRAGRKLALELRRLDGCEIEITRQALTPAGWVTIAGCAADGSPADLARCRARHARRHPVERIGARARRRAKGYAPHGWGVNLFDTVNRIPGDVAARDSW